MEGLEISEICYSQIQQENRYDSEFYQKLYVANEALLRKKSFFQISDKFFVTDGEHGSVIEQESGIKYLTAENVKNGYVDIANVRYVNAEVDRKNARARVAISDVLISIKGTLGTIGVAEEWLLPANMNRDVAILKPLFGKELSAITALFLMSKFGLLQSSRGGSGGVQQMITLERLRKFISPVFSSSFCSSMNEQFQRTQKLRGQSQSLYKQAEALLLKSLGLENFSPSSKNTNIKSFKDSFQVTSRLDAEYYQPKYEEVIAHIKAQPHAKLSELVVIKKSIEPGSDEYSEDAEGLPFLRVADYNKFGITEPQKKLRSSFVTENQDKLDSLMPKAETILFSKDGSVGEAYCLSRDSNFITSGAILHLGVRDKKKVLPDYLTLALNSKLVRMQAERDAGGSIILHWRIGEIEEVLIPVIDPKTQSQISLLVQESFILKSKSEKLLEVAKQAVEMAIEESEEKAIKLIEQQTKNL